MQSWRCVALTFCWCAHQSGRRRTEFGLRARGFASKVGQLDVVFLVDESASLQTTDPDGRRVEGINAALASLAQVADRTADSRVPVKVNVSMMGFGVAATEVVGWSHLDAGTLPDLLEKSGQFAHLDDEIDTDYAAALIGARNQLARFTDKTKADQSCTAILWFTDGKYDIEPRSTGETKPYAPEISINDAASAAALERAGKQLLCKEGGIVDGLRLNDTEIPRLRCRLRSSLPIRTSWRRWPRGLVRNGVG